jgi:hypothetical protein
MKGFSTWTSGMTMIDGLLLVFFLYLLNQNTSSLRELVRLARRIFLSTDPNVEETAERSCVSGAASSDGYMEDDDTLQSDESYYTEVRDPRGDSKSEFSQYGKIRRVRFNNVRVRNYNVIPQTASSSQDDTRTTLTLDWSYSKERELTVDLFERAKAETYPRKSHTRRKISGTPVAGPHKSHRLHSAHVKRPQKMDTSFPNLHQFDALLTS